MRIMIVEDNARMRAMIKQMLMKNLPNIETIHECEDGIEAVRQYAQFQPDWALMDVELKTMDGLAATAAITSANPQARKPASPQARIIMVTNYDYPGEGRREKGERCAFSPRSSPFNSLLHNQTVTLTRRSYEAYTTISKVFAFGRPTDHCEPR